MPNRSDVDRVERDLLARAAAACSAARSARSTTSSRRIAAGDRARPAPVATDAQRTLIARRAVAEVVRAGTTTLVALGALRRVRRRAARRRSAELESGLLDPDDLDGDVAELYAAYRARARPRRLLGPRPAPAPGERAAPARARRLARRARVRVRLRGSDRGRVVAARGARRPRRGRGLAAVRAGPRAFASLQRTAEDLAALADGRTRELAAALVRVRGARARLARARRSSSRRAPTPPPIDGAVSLPRGRRHARHARARRRRGARRCCATASPAEQVALVVPSLDRWRAPLETVFAGLGHPVRDRRPRAARRDAARPRAALAAPLRVGRRRAATSSTRSCARRTRASRARASTSPRAGCAAARSRRRSSSRTETERLREAPLVALRELRAAAIAGRRRARAARPRWSRRRTALDGAAGRRHLAARPALRRRGDAAARRARGAGSGSASRSAADDVIAALERLEVSTGDGGEPGRVAVLDLMRARTRRFEVVFVLGLEEGSLPRRGRSSPFLDDDRRRELGARLERPDPVSRDRYLFYTACTRATRRLFLVREAATDDGAPREPSSFWDDVAAVFDPEDVARATRRAARSRSSRCRSTRRPTARERLRALARALGRRRHGRPRPPALADANGWTRRLAARGRVRPADAPAQPGAARGARDAHDVRRDRARALRRLLVGVAVRARGRPEDDRRRGRRDAAREGRPPGALRVLQRACRRSSAPSA